MSLHLLVGFLFQQEDIALKEAQRWEKPLQTALGRCGSAIVDLPASKWAVPFDRPIALGRLDDFGTVIGREHRVADGVHIMLRRWSSDSYGPASVDVALRAWLSRLTKDELRSLVRGTSIADMSPDSQRVLTRLAFRSNPAVGVRLLEGDRSYRLSLSGGVVADVRDPKTGTVKSLPLPDRVFKLNPPVSRVADELPALPTEAPAHPEESTGPIDFGKGTVMPLANAVDQATLQGGVSYQYDHRLSGSHVFLKGRFTPASFLVALKSVGSVQTPDQRQEPPEPRLDSLGTALEDDDTPQSVRELLKEKNEKPINQVMRETTSLSRFLNDLKLPMDSTVRLRMAPTLWIVGAGSVVDSGATATIGGVPAKVLVANQVGVTIGP